MKNVTLVIAFMALTAASCDSTKKTTQTKTAATTTSATLNGTWALDFVASGGPIDQLYPERKPTITFNEADGTFSAYTGCNTGRGKVIKNGSKINFPADMMMTKMLCQGDGEKIFLGTLKKINTYAISSDGNTLTFIQGDMALMSLHKSTQ